MRQLTVFTDERFDRPHEIAWQDWIGQGLEYKVDGELFKAGTLAEFLNMVVPLCDIDAACVLRAAVDNLRLAAMPKGTPQ